jgi:uncharacterized protein
LIAARAAWSERLRLPRDEAVADALDERAGEEGAAVTEPDFEGARAYALERLERELPETLFYHSLFHTRDDVVPAAERLAALEGVKGGALLLLLTAALYHDIGFVEGASDHETRGARIAAESLPRFGYGEAQIETITGIVMATKLPHAPRTMLERIMADADLDSLGRDDFSTRSKLLRAELEALGKPMSDEAWYGYQVKFLRSHRYFTAAARSLRAAKKQEHLKEVSRRLEVYRSQGR